MIELGTLDIHDDDTSVVEARNKVAELARHMQFSAIWATRLGTITSEIGRSEPAPLRSDNSFLEQ